MQALLPEGIYSPHTSSTPPYLHPYTFNRDSRIINYIPTFNQSHLSRTRRGTPIPPERKPRWSPTDSSPTPSWLWLPFHPGKGRPAESKTSYDGGSNLVPRASPCTGSNHSSTRPLGQDAPMANSLLYNRRGEDILCMKPYSVCP